MAYRIAVIGDVMLDRYVTGSTVRISPEAPVPVVLDRARYSVAGGAANVAINAVALGGDVALVGIVGDDEEADELKALLARHASLKVQLIHDSSRPTVSKTRILSGRQQLVRIDRETVRPLEGAVLSAYLDAAKEAIQAANVVAFSDYAKGALFDPVIQELISFAKQEGAYVIVDPKRRSFGAYAGADLLKPNMQELKECTGMPCFTDSELLASFETLRSVFDGALLVTRAEKGMSLFRSGATPLHVTSAVNEVADVSGAGDTVLAALAVALAAALSLDDAVDRANIAAGIAVGKLGTAVVTAAEVEDSIYRRAIGNIHVGMLATTELACRIVNTWKSKGEKVAFTNGCFDLVHSGHIELLCVAARQADRLVVGLNADESVRRLKGSTRPIQSELHRAKVIGALRMVDLVVLFSDDTPIELIDQLSPDVLVKGADYNEDQIVGGQLIKERGGKIVIVDLVEGQSSTNIIQRISI